ncbi:hypothetical protein [Ramlibacter sp. AN1133]|uniref:hypothetical protein n=1 Tax=Ramlibacter sp. AN1133 TaxID=3133429 RepID=UPI0030BFE465
MPKAKPKDEIEVDLTLPRDRRPLVGLDIEEWRGSMGLTKDRARFALGFRNTNHYNDECKSGALRLETEILLRIYMMYPNPPEWQPYGLPELFELMYGADLKQFEGTTYYLLARNDIGARFTALFDKTKNRQYEWLFTRTDKQPKAGPYIDALLCKLKTVPDPKAVLESTARKVLALRGRDLDSLFPIPTLASPPVRKKTGRRKSTEEKAPKARRTAAPRKSPAAKKAAAPATRKVSAAPAAHKAGGDRARRKKAVAEPA